MPTPNATYYWTGSGSLSTQANWTPTVPAGGFNENNLFVFSGSQSAPTSSSVTNFGSWQFDANFNSYTEIGGAFLLRAGNFSQGAYTLYVGDGKVVASTAAGVQYLLHSGSGRNELWAYIGSGAEYRTMSYYGTAGGGARVRIFGPGKFYFAYNAPAGQTQPNAVGVTIDTGTAAVRGTDYATNTAGNPWGTGTLAFVSGSSRLNIESGGGSRSFSNPVSFPSGATFQIDSGSGITFSNVTSAGGTVTIAGAGTTTFTQALAFSSINFTSTGTLSIAASSTVTGSNVNFGAAGTLTLGAGAYISGPTITGASGTINMGSGGYIISNAPTFTGTINGTLDVAISSFAANFTGEVNVTGGNVSFAGASNGAIASVGFANAYVYAPFATNTGTTILSDSQSRVGGGLNLFGPSGSIAAGRTIRIDKSCALRFYTGAVASNPTTTLANDTTTIFIVTDDASSCTYNGNYNATKSAGQVTIEAAAGGTLILGGSFTTTGAPFGLNADAGYTGTIKTTGSGFSGGATTLPRGTLHVNGTSTTNLGTGLSVSSGAMLACSSTAPYAAQLSGPVTFASGSTFRFGAPV